jgi:tRNA pseudouridine38-40 synthase
MPRYRLDIEYDGAGFAGWQMQEGQPSVQGAIETAITGFSGEAVRIQGAGRTDAGVHATGQVAHVDLAKDWPAKTVMGGINAHLRMAGHRVAILRTAAVPETFNARFSATARHYRYRIINRRAPLALELGQAWLVPRFLDADAMQAAADTLLGRHDFTTFRSAHCQAKSPVRTLDRLQVVRNGEAIDFFVSARSFLHNQVRSFVGTLKRVGEGAWTPETVQQALEARDRARCGALAPADGLFLTAVDYGDG